MTTTRVDHIFEKYLPKLSAEFKREKFDLKEFQKESISKVLDGNNTLCLMPTGGGKSIIYWLSGLAFEGITVVISPLIALIDEQSEKIRQQGYEVLTLHGGIYASKQVELLKKFSNRELNPDFIFVSPERISTDGFFEYCIYTRKGDIKLITIDEVHCVSQWGSSFRPFYKRIPVFLNEIYGEKSWNPIVLALTATLNPKEVMDICEEFKIEKENIIKDKQLMRTEINLKVLKFTDENEKEDKFWDLLEIHRDEKTLVYLYRKYHKRGVEDLTEEAIQKGYKAISFHGDMSAKERQQVIQSFKNGEVNIVFATNAFGMGIDIPDICVVIHFMIPESVEQYYQEVGRAARNIDSANAYILYTNKNVQVKKTHFIDNSFPTLDLLDECFKRITGNQKGLKTLQYYDDEEAQKCLPYFIDNELINIECKGVSNLKMLQDIKDAELKKVYDSTKTKGIIKSILNSSKSAKQIVDMIYSSLIREKVILSKGFDKCLVVNSLVEYISEEKKADLLEYIEQRKSYKHDLLDYFVYLLDQYNDSIQLHQEVGRYLGVPKHYLNKIYATNKGDKVRSKSEVIIANLLYSHDIDYEYEKKLFYTNEKWIEPDFTIKLLSGIELYWEHLGMIGLDSYDKRWRDKLEIYRVHYPGQLMVTYEGPNISIEANNKVQELK